MPKEYLLLNAAESLSESQEEFPAFYRAWWFIIAFPRAWNLPLSWSRSIQFTFSYPVSLRSILIISSHLRQGLSSFIFPSVFPILYVFLVSPEAGTAQLYSAGLWAGWSRVRVPEGTGNFSHHRAQNGSGSHPASYPMGNRSSFPAGKAAGVWSWQLTST
jgi:hypothetical protein